VSEFVPEDPDAIAIAEAWQANPSETASQIAAHAAAAQLEALKPAIAEVLGAAAQDAADAAANEAVDALENLYGKATVTRYKAAMTAYIEAHPGIIPEEKVGDAQFIAETYQGILRAVRPSVDDQSEESAWSEIKSVPPSYADSMTRRGL
jgi:hypothetical protein